MQYLVYDIESIVDKKLLNESQYAGQNLTDEQAYQAEVKKMMEEKNTNFINPTFHIPVCLAAIAVGTDLSIIKIGLLGDPSSAELRAGGERTPENIVRHFWDTYNKSNFIPVDFNGRGYDMRLLELWAYRLGISIHYKHFDKFGIRYRFADDKELDLCEALNNNGAIKFAGGLNVFAKMIGKPGKMDTKGEQVQELYDAGKMFEIEDYCLGDAIDTYFVFLRWKVVRGSISLDQEKHLVELALGKIKEHAEKTGHLKKYWEALHAN
jgi:predicted PolB exonuclease-like 3'-5' exonuclease